MIILQNPMNQKIIAITNKYLARVKKMKAIMKRQDLMKIIKKMKMNQNSNLKEKTTQS